MAQSTIGGDWGPNTVTPPPVSAPKPVKKFGKEWYDKLRKRVITGVLMGTIATYWVLAGEYIFMTGFLVQAAFAIREYHRMCLNAGVIPAQRISAVSCMCSYIIACVAPHFHEMVLPISGTAVMIWLLLMRKAPAKIAEVAASIQGMFVIGYLPSFWLRLRGQDTVIASGLTHIMDSYWPQWLYPYFPGPLQWTQGAKVIWWTYLAIVATDVGAFFVGNSFGKHKLSTISAAAGATSPNKTLEGLIGGWASTALVSTLAAFFLKWPLWWLTGPSYGLVLGITAVIGDLTASMFKRDAKMKDSGGLLPGHGGLLDRVDSYLFSAPAAFIFYTQILPLAAKF